MKFLPELRQHKQYVLIENVNDQVRVSSIGFSPMGEEEIFQESELSNSVIAGSSSLLSFKSANTYAYMRSSNHINIIGSISNS